MMNTPETAYQDVCIYCKASNTVPSEEHVIADGLGGSIHLRARDVCKQCNNQIAREIDAPVREDLTPILAQLGVRGKYGDAVRWHVTEMVDGVARKFVVTAIDTYAAEPRKLLSQTEDTYAFRANSAEELERARKEVAAKFPGRRVELEAVESYPPDLPESREDNIDFTMPHWARWAAKTCLNVICYCFGGKVALSEGLNDLRGTALQGDNHPADLIFGGMGDSVAEIDELVAQHTISSVMAEGVLTIRVNMFGFCGLHFTREFANLSDASRDVVLDAVEKRKLKDQMAPHAETSG